MINATLWNFLKAIGIAVVVSLVISSIYGLAGLILGFSVDAGEMDIRQIFGHAVSAFTMTFPCIVPIVWLVAFALLQRRLTKNPPAPQD